MIKRHPNLELLLQEFPIENFDTMNFEHLERLNKLSIEPIGKNAGQLPEIPPFEKHPYLVPLDEKSQASGLLIGTFPPISYVCSQKDLTCLRFNSQIFPAPDIDYFHGNYSSFWKYAPIGFDKIQNSSREDQPKKVQDALENAGIIYTDIIQFCQRILNKNRRYNASDENLHSIIPNTDVFKFLKNSTSINRLYFTNASFFHSDNNFFNGGGKVRLYKNDAFGLFVKTALDQKLKVAYRLWDQNNWIELKEPIELDIKTTVHNDLKAKVVLNLRLIWNDNGTEIKNEYAICSSVSPAAVNRGTVKGNPCVKRYQATAKSSIEEAPAGLLRTTLACFFKNQLIDLARYNA